MYQIVKKKIVNFVFELPNPCKIVDKPILRILNTYAYV